MCKFQKQERLTGKPDIDSLFLKGNRFSVYPFVVIWTLTDKTDRHPAKILVAVSRKHRFKAVQRNYIKRIIREAYRKNKYALYDFLVENNLRCNFVVLYSGKDIYPYNETEKKIILILRRLTEEINYTK